MGTVIQRVEDETAPKLGRRLTLRSGEYAPWLSCVVFYLIFANIPYWAIWRVSGFSPTGLFCVEYSVVGLISLFVPRFVTIPLLFLAICADILCGICETFLIPVRECLLNVHAAHAFSFTRLLYAVSALVLTLLTAVAAVFVPGRSLTKPERWKAAICLMAFAVLIVGTDVVSIRLATGHFPLSSLSETSMDELNTGRDSIVLLARVPLFRLMRLEKIDAANRAKEMRGMGKQTPVLGATAAAIQAAGIFSTDNHPLPNLVVVVVESWGLANDAPLRQALVQPYFEPDVLSKYEVIQGTAPFYGSTVAGEARELCGTSIGYYLMDAPATELKGCLPDRLAAIGYRPVAVHGMIGFMFSRNRWYKTIGFQETWFHTALKRQGLHDCIGAFVGTCDADIAAWIGRRLDQSASRPYFIHWMTLNSHLPVPVPTPLSNPAPCEASFSVTPGTALCSWYQLIDNVQRSVVQMATGNLQRPTLFVIVGDHMPPFGNLDVRNRFSHSDVPYVVLVPRSIANSKADFDSSAVKPLPEVSGLSH